MPTKTKAFLSFFILLILAPFARLSAQGDIPVGTWRTHLSYQHLEYLAIAKDKIYAAGNNAFLVFDKEDNSISRLSKISGFSDVDITALVYNEEKDILFIGYRNGNFDMLQNGAIVNDPTFKRASINGSKKINDFTTYNDFAFISSDYGVLVYNLEKSELKEIYAGLGSDGSLLQIHSGEIFQDSLFLATEKGVIAGSLSTETNLMDFAKWKRFSSEENLQEVPIHDIDAFDNRLFVGVDQQGVFAYEDGVWNLTSIQTGGSINSLSSSNGVLSASLPEGIYVYSSEGNFQLIADASFGDPQKALYDSENTLWVADNKTGLISIVDGNINQHSPTGPSSNISWDLFYFDDRIARVSGGFGVDFLPNQNTTAVSILYRGDWKNYHHGSADLVDATYVPQTKKMYFASFGGGLIEWVPEEEQFTIINNQTPGSTLRSSSKNPELTIVTGVEPDLQGSLWITNYDSPLPLHKMDSEGNMKSFSFNLSGTQFPLGLVISANNDKWIRLQSQRGSEILVVDESGESSRILDSKANNGLLPGNSVTAISQDFDGYMWIGTDEGLVYIFNSYSILSNESVNAVVPVYNNGFLLKDEHVTTIKVDGGNRKWVGTTTGLWLFEDAGEELVNHFTVENSPLPSNHVLDVEINEHSGEVFISTDKGLVSFRGTATKGEQAHQDVKIFPNPVNENFTGMMGISGLANDANVKITDIRGQLVKQLFAEGGTAVWDLKDNDGRRASSGVYLVLSTTEDGEEKFVGKFAVVE